MKLPVTGLAPDAPNCIPVRASPALVVIVIISPLSGSDAERLNTRLEPTQASIDIVSNNVPFCRLMTPGRSN